MCNVQATQAIIGGKLGILQRLLRKSSAADLLPNGSLALAALHGKEEILRFLLDQKLNIEEAGELGTPLRCAVLNGHSDICRLLVDLGADLNGNGRLGSALHAAAMKGRLQTVRLLIQLGADVDINGGYYGTPLQAATCLGHAETVRLLLSAHASPHKPGLSKDAFHAAAENGQYHIIQILLSAGFQPPVPISWGKTRARRRSPPQARNLLRESSPSVKKEKRLLKWSHRVRAWRKGHNVRGLPDDSDDISSDDDEKLTDLTQEEPEIHPKPYRPLRRKPSDANFNAPDGNYPFEAAAELGHLETVSMMLENRMFFDLTISAVEQALSAACRSGHKQIVKKILEWREDIPMDLGKPLSEAVSCGHVNVIMTLLKDGTPINNKKKYLKMALESAIYPPRAWDTQPRPEAIFHEILNSANEEFPKLEITDLILACLDEALGADRADIVKVILGRSTDLSYERLLNMFCQTLESAKARTAAVIYDALQERNFSPSRSQFHQFILLSAGNGLAQLTSQLLRHRDICFDCDGQLLQEALNIAAHHGHHEVCTYLLSKGVDPCLSAHIITSHEVPSRKYGLSHTIFESFRSENLPSEGTISAEKRVTALASSLSGYQRFRPGNREHRNANAAWRKADEKTQADTIRLTLDHIPSMKGMDLAKDICCAATCCPPDILQLLIEKGADPLAHIENVSVLQFAARRERLSFMVSRILIEAGADKNMTESEMQLLLDEALKHFRAPSHSREDERNDRSARLPRSFSNTLYKDYGKLLTETESLEDVFITGPGALVYYLLGRIPGFRLDLDPAGILLQCAAAAGHDNLVEILVEHGADVNWTGSYYGTALQAASRFGHAQIARVLLQSGSDPNLNGGRHGTALRAAVLARSLEIVTLLLQSGAYEYDQGTDLAIALQHALHNKDTDIALTLVAAGANVVSEDQSAQPLFIQACSTGYLPLIEALLNIGTNVNVYGIKSSTSIKQETGSPVHSAIHIQRTDIVKILLAKGFELESDFGDFDHPLCFAIRKGDLQTLDILLDSMSECSSKVLREAIEMAIMMSDLAAITKLIQYYEANFSSENNFDFVSGLLKKACGAQKIQVTKMLLDWLSQCGMVHEEIIRDVLKEACARQNAPATEMLLGWLSERGAVAAICTTLLRDIPSTSAEIYEILL
ncbi:uncharacterized protein BHQ10_002690 [Talaromyces amestolkiae]|uniref:Uncharacterized protein n=1 Tax=Talaromyces amestolkiae TaxID=1196081 RepID=A0A364KSZ3_TALAM|nr:uncharacterized protein BHQ10_002690 [Talaromyces amestolkiae]RAO66678.1 hypothetical protein BHQ10_002690 [Talaromyces amestolkiae]